MRASPLKQELVDGPALDVEAWARLPEDEVGELVAGRLTEAELPDATHETTFTELYAQLLPWVRDQGALLFGSGLKYGLTDRQGRIPDLSIFFAGRRPPARGIVRDPPDVVVEIVSPSPSDARRDRIDKLADYASFGVRWYWIVDPALRTFEVLELRDGRYSHVGAATHGQVSELPGCPGLVIDLDAIWAAVDRLG